MRSLLPFVSRGCRAVRAHAVPLVAALVVGATACTHGSRLTEPQPRDQLYASLIGTWRGTLIAAPSALGGAPIAIPTTLVVAPAPDQDGLELRYRQTRADGSTTTRVDHLHFDRRLQHARWGDARDAAAQPFTVLERRGGANGAPLRVVLGGARARETVEVSTGTVRILTETATSAGGYVFAQEFGLRRAE